MSRSCPDADSDGRLPIVIPAARHGGGRSPKLGRRACAKVVQCSETVAERRISEEWKPVVDANVVSRRVEDTVVIVHLGTDRIYELNRTGGRLWELLEEGSTYGEALLALQDEFEVDREKLEREAEKFVDMLVSEDVVGEPAPD
jgi:Coenzyme PQQ synthesis protein D (PqqD)